MIEPQHKHTRRWAASVTFRLLYSWRKRACVCCIMLIDHGVGLDAVSNTHRPCSPSLYWRQSFF